METIEIKITNKCNWNCYYCAENIHNHPKIDLENIKKIIYENRENHIILSGGEPGLMSKQFFDFVFSVAKKVSVNTNGLIFKHLEIINKFNSIRYHCSINLDLDVIEYNYSNVEYLIIVTNENIHKLELFLNHYKHINFDVIPDDRNNGINLNKDNVIFLKNIIFKYKNVLTKSKYYFLTKNRYNIKYV